MSTEAEKLLVKQIRQGDPQAWERLINLYEGRLLAFAVRRVRDRSAAEDIIRRRSSATGTRCRASTKRELQTYLFTIASYKVTDHLRPHRSRPAAGERRPADGRAADDRQRAASAWPVTSESSWSRRPSPRRSKQMIDQWRDKNSSAPVLELLFVKGWANQDVAKLLNERAAGGELPVRGSEEAVRTRPGRRPAGGRVPRVERGRCRGGLSDARGRVIAPSSPPD